MGDQGRCRGDKRASCKVFPPLRELVTKGGDDDDTQGSLRAGLSPKYGTNALDLEVVMFTSGKGSHLLPRNGIILAKLFRSWSFCPITSGKTSGSTLARLGKGEVMNRHVLASPANVSAAFRHASQDGFVREATIAVKDEVPTIGDFFSKQLDACQADSIEILLFKCFTVDRLLLLRVFGFLLGFDWTGGMLKIDRDHAGFPIHKGSGCREL